MRYILTFIFAALIAPAISFGQALADRLPGDAEIYVGWSGTDSIGPGYDQSHLKAILDASQLRQFVHDSIPRLINAIAEKDPQSAKQVQLVLDLLAPLAAHPSAFYFGGMTQGAPLPKVALMCDAGPDADRIVTQVSQLLQQAPGNPFTCRAIGTLVVLSDFAYPDQMENPLSKSAAFQAAMGNLGKDPAAALYVNATAVTNTINDAVQIYGPPQAKQIWAQVRNTSGISGLKTIAATAGLDGKNWAVKLDVLAPAPRQGLMAMGDVDPLAPDLIKLIPVTSTIAGAFSFDLDKLFTQVVHLVEQFAPEQSTQIQQSLGQVNQMLGFDIQKDFLAAMGPQWGYYVDPATVGDGILGTTIVNRPRNAEQLQTSLTTLETMANAMIQQQMQGNDPKMTVEFRQEAIEGTTVHYLATPVITPSWAIKNGTFYIGLFPQMVVAAMDQPSDGKSIQDNPDFQAVQQKLNAPASVSSFGYVDLPKTLPGSYQICLLINRLYFGLGDLFGAHSPPLILPTLGKILPELEPAGSAGWADDAGFHFRGIEPFPLANALGSAQSMSGIGVGQSAMMVSVLLPSLNRARETANRVKCASNLRQIGMAVLLYSNDNHGKYPPDLGTLIKTEDITASVFVCPDTNSQPPPGMTPDQAADWVNHNSDYVYLGAGMVQGQQPSTVVCYEKDKDHGGDGINMLFGDGHVEFFTLPAAHQMIEKSGNPQGKSGNGNDGL
jgi:prepilin-type processing-associated H-X9-DG protein